MNNDVKQRELSAAYTNMCNDKHGYKVLLDILNYCALFVTGAGDSNNLWLREGQKSVASYIVGRLQEADHNNYPDLLKKHATEVYEEEKRREAEEKEDGGRKKA